MKDVAFQAYMMLCEPLHPYVRFVVHRRWLTIRRIRGLSAYRLIPAWVARQRPGSPVFLH